MNLSSAKMNISLVIRGIEGNDETVARLQELGLFMDTEISVVRKSPLSGPLILRVGTAFIVMRKKDAANIQVEEKA